MIAVLFGKWKTHHPTIEAVKIRKDRSFYERDAFRIYLSWIRKQQSCQATSLQITIIKKIMSNNNMLHEVSLKSQDEVTAQLEDATALLAQEEEIVTPDALETGRMLAKVTACSCIPLITTFNTTVWGSISPDLPTEGRLKWEAPETRGDDGARTRLSYKSILFRMNGPFLRWAHARLRILPTLWKIIMPMPIPYGKQAMPPEFISVFKSTVLCANSG